jgi:23S rRNA (guanosine2251-2'-O)-methyltransferase
VVKASAGVAFRAPVLRAATAEEGCAALRDGGFRVFGLAAAGPSLLDADLPRRVALVLGNETDGLSAAVRAECDATLAIPMQGGVESLNVASAAAVAAFELLRRRR